MATNDFNSATTNNKDRDGHNHNTRSFFRVCDLLVAIEQLEKPDLKNLVEKTSIPSRSIHSMIERLQREYHLVVKRQNGRRYGYYEIVDWGILSKERVLWNTLTTSELAEIATRKKENVAVA